MLFYPVRFRGVRLPGLAPLANILPRRVQQIPGVMQGGVGWQGIIPSRAAKMGSIAVDKGIAKLGSPADFYQQLEPERIAEHILVTARGTSATSSSGSCSASTRSCGTTCRRASARPCTQRVQQQLPDDRPRGHRTRSATNIDQLLDVKLMVIRRMEAQPELANRIFLEVGQQGAAVHHQLRLLLRLRCSASRWLSSPRPCSALVGAADRAAS